ncbi:hypothetical protein GCM10025857_22160 [Alicyclobacillus contaminans]|nr:hypothetical protein GCM10025857_22160 [Alicyclobacillus contaminans]
MISHCIQRMVGNLLCRVIDTSGFPTEALSIRDGQGVLHAVRGGRLGSMLGRSALEQAQEEAR